MTMTQYGHLFGFIFLLMFPLRMQLDRCMTWPQRRAWAAVCAVLPIIGYVISPIVRAVRSHSASQAA